MRTTEPLLIVIVFSSAACSSAAAPSTRPAGCQVLAAEPECFLPFPSDHFLVEDPSLPSGHRVEIAPNVSLFSEVSGKNADPNSRRAVDGFSPMATIVATLGSPASDAGLTSILEAPGNTMSLESKTLIVDAEDRTLVPHFADLDPRPSDAAARAIVLHPLVRLVPRHRYIVVLKSVLGPDGAPVTPAPGYAKIAAGDRDPALEPDATHLRDRVFPVLDQLGLLPSALDLAFDFTVGSSEHIEGDLLEVRALTIEWLKTHTPKVEIVERFSDPRPEIWRELYGTVEVPLFLEAPGAGSQLRRDAAGHVLQGGTTTVPFIAEIPRSVRDQFAPGRLLGFGHGFFGMRQEVLDPPVRNIADRAHRIVLAIDWWGMSRSDLPLVVDGLVNAPGTSLDFVDRTHQGMANWMVLLAAAERSLTTLPDFRRPDEAGTAGVQTSTGGVSNRGQSLIDPSSPAFLGISMGHILGGVLAAVEPRLERIALEVGGAGFTQLMSRARPFAAYLTFMEQSLPKKEDQMKFIALSQTALDRIDPGNWAHHVLQQPLPGQAERRLLLQLGLGDVEVPNMAGFLHARALGLPLLSPAPSQPYGLALQPAPAESGLMLFDLGIDQSVYRVAAPPDGANRVHNALREAEPAVLQLERFFDSGEITNPCPGPCTL